MSQHEVPQGRSARFSVNFNLMTDEERVEHHRQCDAEDRAARMPKERGINVDVKGNAAKDRQAAEMAFARLGCRPQVCRIDWYGDTTARVTVAGRTVEVRLS